jgi:hypothetical protein
VRRWQIAATETPHAFSEIREIEQDGGELAGTRQNADDNARRAPTFRTTISARSIRTSARFSCCNVVQ